MLQNVFKSLLNSAVSPCAAAGGLVLRWGQGYGQWRWAVVHRQMQAPIFQTEPLDIQCKTVAVSRCYSPGLPFRSIETVQASG